jgi:hypothetical protein
VSDKKIIDLKDICEGLWEALRAVEYPHDLREVTKAELYTQCQELAECYKQLDARNKLLERVLEAAENYMQIDKFMTAEYGGGLRDAIRAAQDSENDFYKNFVHEYHEEQKLQGDMLSEYVRKLEVVLKSAEKIVSSNVVYSYDELREAIKEAVRAARGGDEKEG